MNEKIIKILFTALAVLLLGMTAYAAASAGAEDPIVTKSYVDKAIERAIEDYGKKHESGEENAAQGYTFEVVRMKAGEKLVCGEGTEIIVRSGKASAIDNGSDGVSDITSGKDLMSGDSAAQNHLLVVPRNDGRGIKASGEVYIMVKGEYAIKKQ